MQVTVELWWLHGLRAWWFTASNLSVLQQQLLMSISEKVIGFDSFSGFNQ